MATIEDLKELETPQTPLFLFECMLMNGDVHRWSTHQATLNGNVYAARVLKHNLLELRSSSDEATDGISKVSLTLANADSFFSPIEQTIGWKGARLTARVVFYDLQSGSPASDNRIVFRGVANPPDQSTESYLRLSFTTRLSLQRVLLPETRIQKRCPWSFPSAPAQQVEALNGGPRSSFSSFYRCGYSVGVPNGVGNLNGTAPFETCDYSRAQCIQRGMFDKDSSGNVTRRFGGIEFVPSTVLVRSYGEKGSHYSSPLDNQARYNDFVPLIYGTGWYNPPIVFARNDGNLTHTEVLLGVGPLTSVIKVIVNGVEVPEAVAGANMTATGWYSKVTLGERNGNFNADFTDTSGAPLGDPYGSLGCLSVVVPNIISDGRSLPQIQVLIEGLKLATFDLSGSYLADKFTNNPAWVMLDVLRRSGWTLDDVDPSSFARAAARCDQLISSTDLNGNPVEIPSFQCNLILTTRRSAADVVRGIRTGAGLYLIYNSDGLLAVRSEDTIAAQQPDKPLGSNSQAALNGGWPAYEFGDSAFSGILRSTNGSSSLRVSCRSSADTPNQYTVEFQDQFNEYQQDSLSLVDLEDSSRAGQEITIALTALGIPNFDQATRTMSLQLSKSVHGNVYVDFDTTVKAVDLRPGDIIAITYTKEGWNRQPFRIIRIAPNTNYRTASITAQIHDDDWYSSSGMTSAGTGRQPDFGIGLPRALVGSVTDEMGNPVFGINETVVQATDGTVTVQLAASFVQPAKIQPSSAGVPLVGLNAQMSSTGGSLHGGQTLYYGITSVDQGGSESGLSFLVKADIPSDTVTNQVTLPSISLSPAASGFYVYRGPSPQQLLRITDLQPIAANFTDSGLIALSAGPPDQNYDHANFYWRLELQPEAEADVGSPTTIGNSNLRMQANEFAGSVVRITRGTGAGQERIITGTTATTLTVDRSWTLEPDRSSMFVVAESAWQFGTTGPASPISFTVPNRAGETVHVSGRSANVRNEECAYDLCPLARWRISGSGGVQLDSDAPDKPLFGIEAVGQGSIEVSALSFADFTNTRSVSAGTLTVYYWPELDGVTDCALGADLSTELPSVTLAVDVSVKTGDLMQVDSEIMIVQQDATNTSLVTVSRGACGCAAASHSSGTAVYLLKSKTFVMAFARDFFGSPASGSYSHPVYLPDVRLAAASLFVTNSKGNSDTGWVALTGTSSMGLRTLSGGQLTIQVDGSLAVQTNAAPPLTIEADRSIRDIFATVGAAPTGMPIELQLTVDAVPLCALSLQPGTTVSNVIDGFLLGPLRENAVLGLDILAVPTSSDTVPGSDLTVTIRL